MNRRGFFSFLAAVPIAVGVVKEAAARPSRPAVPKPDFPVGHLVDTYEIAPDYSGTAYLSGHTHTLTVAELPQHQHVVTGIYPSRAVVRRKIYDGKQFVDFDSPAGLAVYNSVLSRTLVN